MTNRYLDGERPAPRAGRRIAAGRRLGGHPAACYGERLEACLLHDALGRAVGVRRRRRTGSSTPSSRGSWPRPPRPATTAARRGSAACSGDLLEACRLVGLAVAPFMPGIGAARPRPARLRLRRTRPTATAARPSSTSWPGAPSGGARPRDGARAALPAPRRRGARRPAKSPPRTRPAMRLRRQHCHLNADRFEGDAGPGRSAAPGWPASSGSSSRAGTSPRSSARSRWSTVPGSTPRSASIRTTPPRSTTRGWARIVGWATRRASRRDRRDRPRLRPASSARSRTSSTTCAGTWRWRSRPASRRSSIADPATGGATPRTRCSRSCGRPASATAPGPPRSAIGRRRSSTRSPGPVDYAPRDDRPRRSRSASRASSSGRRGGVRGGRRARPRPTACWSRPIRRSCRRPARRAGATSPSGCRITAAWLAERRGVDAGRRSASRLVDGLRRARSRDAERQRRLTGATRVR